jgi:hypothetical protein
LVSGVCDEFIFDGEREGAVDAEASKRQDFISEVFGLMPVVV